MSRIFDAYRETIFQNMADAQANSAWVYWPKTGARKWTAWLLRRPMYDSIWLGPVDDNGAPDERIKVVLHWNAAGLLTLEDEA
jgi:hypothetical protein